MAMLIAGSLRNSGLVTLPYHLIAVKQGKINGKQCWYFRDHWINEDRTQHKNERCHWPLQYYKNQGKLHVNPAYA